MYAKHTSKQNPYLDSSGSLRVDDYEKPTLAGLTSISSGIVSSLCCFEYLPHLTIIDWMACCKYGSKMKGKIQINHASSSAPVHLKQ